MKPDPDHPRLPRMPGARIVAATPLLLLAVACAALALWPVLRASDTAPAAAQAAEPVFDDPAPAA